MGHYKYCICSIDYTRIFYGHSHPQSVLVQSGPQLLGKYNDYVSCYFNLSVYFFHKM